MYKNLAKPFFIGKRVVYMPSCHSTNEIASELVKKEQKHEGTIVITNQQTAGKGQLGNSWEAQPEMNLTFSMIIKPKMLIVKDHFMLNIISSLAVRDFVAKYYPHNVKVKWPNDIYVGDNKIAGILISNTLRSSEIDNSIIGIGLNINQVEFEIDNAISLKLCTGQQFLLGECLEELVLEIEKRYFQMLRKERDQLFEDYQNQLYWKNEVHTFKSKQHFFSGIIKGINNLGQLHIELEEGDEYFNFKEVSFIR
ncbi:MAG: biotin--[acetyl-CoA-carboxylase] ligase [Cyclobacteriaceae bacterium]|nr:biotin--[acetyl-CoA-carboxylase] ligase [Cyclobacteriaceae bacterium]